MAPGAKACGLGGAASHANSARRSAKKAEIVSLDRRGAIEDRVAESHLAFSRVVDE